jgi:hypothetical protein
MPSGLQCGQHVTSARRLLSPVMRRSPSMSFEQPRPEMRRRGIYPSAGGSVAFAITVH